MVNVMTVVPTTADIPAIESSVVPWLSAAEMRAVDDVTVRELGIELKQMMRALDGVLHVPHVRAEATMTLAAPKTGLRGAAVVGDLYLADISVPAAAFERIGRAYATPFAESPLVRLVEP